MRLLILLLLLFRVYLGVTEHQSSSQSITVLTPLRCPQGGVGIPPVTVCSFVPNSQGCCGTDPPLDNLENLCPITSLTSTDSDRRNCRESFLSYWCTRSCVRTTASVCSQAFQSTVSSCSTACPDMMGVLLPTSATGFLGSSASASTSCTSYSYSPPADTATPTIQNFTANYVLIGSAKQAQFTYSISIVSTNIPEGQIAVTKTEAGAPSTVFTTTTIFFSSWKYVTTGSSSIYTTTYPVLIDSNFIPYGQLSVSATLTVTNSKGSTSQTVTTQLHTMTPTPTPTKRRTLTSTVTPVPYQCVDPSTTAGNTVVPVNVYNTPSCSGTPLFMLPLPLNYGSSWCNCFTAASALYSATNFKCVSTSQAVTFSLFLNDYLCSIQNIYTQTVVSVSTACNPASFLNGNLYAVIANYTPCIGWQRAATLTIQVSAADFNRQLISLMRHGSLVDLTSLPTNQIIQLVQDIKSEGTQVMTSDARIESIIDCTILPLGKDGWPVVMQRTPSTPTSRIWSVGSQCAAAVVTVVDPAKSVAQLNMTLPAFPYMPNYTLTWMTDVISFSRFDASGNVIHYDPAPVRFDVSCSSSLFLHFCQFDRLSGGYCNLLQSTIVQNGKGWCTVTSPSTSSFIGFQALPQVSEQSSGFPTLSPPLTSLVSLLLALTLVTALLAPTL